MTTDLTTPFMMRYILLLNCLQLTKSLGLFYSTAQKFLLVTCLFTCLKYFTELSWNMLFNDLETFVGYFPEVIETFN